MHRFSSETLALCKSLTYLFILSMVRLMHQNTIRLTHKSITGLLLLLSLIKTQETHQLVQPAVQGLGWLRDLQEHCWCTADWTCTEAVVGCLLASATWHPSLAHWHCLTPQTPHITSISGTLALPNTTDTQVRTTHWSGVVCKKNILSKFCQCNSNLSEIVWRV